MTLFPWLIDLMVPVDTVVRNFMTRFIPEESLIPTQNLICFCFIMLLVFTIARHIYFRKPTKFVEWVSVTTTTLVVLLSFTFGVMLAVTFPTVTTPYLILAIFRVVLLLITLITMLLLEKTVTFFWEKEMIRKAQKKQKDRK